MKTKDYLAKIEPLHYKYEDTHTWDLLGTLIGATERTLEGIDRKSGAQIIAGVYGLGEACSLLRDGPYKLAWSEWQDVCGNSLDEVIREAWGNKRTPFGMNI